MASRSAGQSIIVRYGAEGCPHSGTCNKAVRQRSDLLFIETSFWFEESPCAVRTNTAGLGRLCTLSVLSTQLVFEHMHAVLSSMLVLCCTMVTTNHCCYE